MKNLVIALLLVTTVTFGSLLLKRSGQHREDASNLELARKQVAQLEAEAEQKEEEARRLRPTPSAPRADTAERRVEAVPTAAAADPGGQPQPAKPGNPLAQMFKDPEMREMIQKQQQAAMVPLVEKSYGSLFTSLKLSPEKREALKNLILKRMQGDTALGMELVGGEVSAERQAELTQQGENNRKAVESEIKDLLGEENATAFKDYEKTIPDRMLVGQFKDRLTGSAAMSSEQESMLVTAMSEERLGFKFTTDLNDQKNVQGMLAGQLSEEGMTRFFQEQEQLNHRYVTRAQGILSGEQLEAYQKSLQTQQEMMRMGMKMAAQMLGGGKKP